MMRILLLDDDAAKAAGVEMVIDRLIGLDGANVTKVANAFDAGAAMRRERYDLLVLDLNVPLREGEPAKRDGGVQLLQQLARRKEWNTPTHILGLTAYDELAVEFTGAFQRELWHLVKYDPSTTEWSDALGRKLLHIVQARQGTREGYGTDLAIITALHKVELEAVLALDAHWVRQNIAGDDTFYHRGVFSREGRSVSVVAAACSEMGMPAAAALTMKVVESFRPRYVVMAGIAAGVKGGFGDVLVAEQSWDYGSGKRLASKPGRSAFLPAPSYIGLDPLARAKLAYFGMDQHVLRAIVSRWKRRGQKPKGPVSVHMGPVASGAAVVQSRDVIRALLKQNRKLIGVEMETYGLFMAARECRQPRPVAVSIKCICDFGGKGKNDNYQRFAAFVSANYVYEFALEHIAQEGEGRAVAPRAEGRAS